MSEAFSDVPDAPSGVDLDVERDVLSQLLAFDVYASYSAEGLRADAFFREAHRLVFTAVANVAQGGHRVDVAVVRQELLRQQWMEEVREDYYARLTEGAPKPSPENIRYQVHKLLDLQTVRAVLTAAQALHREVSTKPETVSDGTVAQRLSDIQVLLAGPRGRAPLLTADRQLEVFTTEMAREGEARVWFGFPALDEAVGGVRAGEVCGWMARPGVGKTITLCNVACRAADSDGGHVLFSLEMPAAQIVERLIQIRYGLSREDLRDQVTTGRFDGTEYQQVFGRLVIIDQPGLSVPQMESLLRHIAMGPLCGVPLRLVTVDHLGLIGGDRALSTYERVSTQARELKELAKRFETAVLLAIQVNRADGGDGSRELGLSAARDSGVVEEAMDYLLAIRRLDYAASGSRRSRAQFQNVLFTKIVKNRHGTPGHEVALRLSPDSLRLREDTELTSEETEMAWVAQTRGPRR